MTTLDKGGVEKCGSCQGVSLIAATLALAFLGMMGFVIAYIVAVAGQAKVTHLRSVQSFYLAQAGIEYAIKQINDQKDLDTLKNKIIPFRANCTLPYGVDGSFTIAQTPPNAAGRITSVVTATVGNTQAIYTVDNPTQAQCTDIDSKGGKVVGGKQAHQGTSFRKKCLFVTILSQIKFEWTPSSSGEQLVGIYIKDQKTNEISSPFKSGDLIDLADITLQGNEANYSNNKYEWNTDISEKQIKMTFYYGDRSQECCTITTASPNCGKCL